MRTEFLWFAGLVVVLLALTTCNPDVHAQKAGTTQFAGDLPAQSSPVEDGLFVGPDPAQVADPITITIPPAGSLVEWVQSLAIGLIFWFIRKKTGIIVEKPPK